MDEAKSIHTPVDTSTKLVQAGEEDSLIDQSLYRLAVGSLMYLSTATRPDIPYAVNNDAHGSVQAAYSFVLCHQLLTVVVLFST